MSHEIRIQITRRSGAPFAGARCAIAPDGNDSAQHVEIADEHGYVYFTIPTVARSRIRVTASPPSPRQQLASAPPWERNDTAFWPVTCALEYDPTIDCLALGERPLEVVRVDESSGTTEIEIRLLRVRNIDAIARRILGPHVVAGEKVSYPPVEPSPPGPLPYGHTLVPLLDEDRRVQRMAVTVEGDGRRASLLEIAARKGVDGRDEPNFAPKCVGTYFPDEVAALDEPPVLLYFRPTADQDFNGRWSGFEDLPSDQVTTQTYTLDRDGPEPYARAAYYFEWFFRRTFEYVIDPWARSGAMPYAAGLIDQIRASGKRLGVVAPVPEATMPNGGFGHAAADLAFLNELIAEILEHVELRSFASRGAPAPRPLRAPGRIAAAGFSSGNLTLHSFVHAVLGSSARSPITDHLRELYFLDPPASFGPSVIPDGVRFMKARPENVLRIYAQGDYILSADFADLRKALDPSARDGVPLDLTWEQAPDPRPGHPHRTAAYLPPAAWPAEGAIWGEIHSFVPATMIAHALALSGFPE